MNREAIGAMAELLAASAVIVSFFYLATQIRQNTDQISQSVKSQQISASQAIMASGHQARAQIISELRRLLAIPSAPERPDASLTA